MYWNPQWEQQSLQQAHGWNPFYNPYSPKADIFGGLSGVLGMMSQKKQMEEQQRLAQEQQMWERGMKERQVKVQEKAAEPTPAKPSELDTWMKYGESVNFGGLQPYEWMMLSKRALPETPEQMEAGEAAKARGRATVPTVERPSDYDKRSAKAAKLREAGKITEQEHIRIDTGYSGGESDKDTLAARRKVDFETRRAVGAATKQIGKPKDIRNAGIVDTVTGLNLAMPIEYNLSAKRIEADLADDSDYDTVEKYDQMFKFFQDNLLGKMKFEDFMKTDLAKDPSIDKERIKAWFEIFR